jgi:thiol-disulfide isomerase/thioredoxin
MTDLKHPIGYLERADFSEAGDLTGQLSGKPVFVMIQGSYCGGCTSAKPDFQKLGDNGAVACMTIQIDGDRKSEKDIQSSGVLNNIYPNLETIPSYILYIDGKKRIPYKGNDRSFNAMKQFIQQHI